MAIATSTAIILGAAAAVSAGTAAYGSHKQAEAAKKARERYQSAGERGYRAIAEAAGQGRSDLSSGYDAARQDLKGADKLLQDQGAYNEDIFAQERSVGSSALDRLNRAIINGDQSAVQMDAGYQFRQDEGNKAIERAAAAAGSFGSGGNLKDFSRFNQGLASDEYGAAIQRLAGLASVGQSANSQLASLNTGLAGQRASVYGALANNSQNRGTALAMLGQNSAAAQANALNNQATNVNNAGLQEANALAFGANQIGATANNAASNALLISYLQGTGTGKAAPTGTSGLRTPVPGGAP